MDTPMNDGPIAGLTVTKTPVFTSLVSDYDWPRKMLVAMESAKALGVSRFEIEAEPATVSTPVTRPISVSAYSGFPIYETVGSKVEPTQRVTLYALRIEDTR